MPSRVCVLSRNFWELPPVRCITSMSVIMFPEYALTLHKKRPWQLPRVADSSSLHMAFGSSPQATCDHAR